MIKLHIFLALAILTVFSACEPSTELANGSWPTEFRIGFTPPQDNAQDEMALVNDFAVYLSKKLKMPVKMVFLTDYGPQIEALKANRIDIATLGSFSFVIAEQRANVEPLIMRVDKETGKGTYFSTIMTNRQDIRSIDDVKRLAPTLKLAFGNPASTSGHLIPRKFLEESGINCKTGFKRVLHCPEHTATLMSLLAGHIDVAGINKSTVDKYLKPEEISKEGLHVLWVSDPIPLDPWVVRKALPEAFKQQVLQAFLDLPLEQPEIYKAILGSSDPKLVFAPARTEMWDPIRELAAKLQKDLYE